MEYNQRMEKRAFICKYVLNRALSGNVAATRIEGVDKIYYKSLADFAAYEYDRMMDATKE